MDWNSWHTLLTVASTGTYSAAAKALRTDATTISRRISRLEKSHGGRLLVRSDGRLQPTPACEALMPQLEKAAGALAHLSGVRGQKATGTGWRTIRITAVGFICDHLLARSIADLPTRSAVKLELVSDNRNLSLSRREADFALRFAPPQSGNTLNTRLGNVRYACFAARGSLKEKLPWATLDSAFAHLPEVQCAQKAARTDGGIRFTATSMQGLIEIVKSGAARAILPVFVAELSGGLCMCDSEFEVTRTLWLLWHKQMEETMSHMAVKDWILRTCLMPG